MAKWKRNVLTRDILKEWAGKPVIMTLIDDDGETQEVAGYIMALDGDNDIVFAYDDEGDIGYNYSSLHQMIEISDEDASIGFTLKQALEVVDEMLEEKYGWEILVTK